MPGGLKIFPDGNVCAVPVAAAVHGVVLKSAISFEFFRNVAIRLLGGAVLCHQFQSRVFISAQSDAFPIRKHEPLMAADFLDHIFCHLGTPHRASHSTLRPLRYC